MHPSKNYRKPLLILIWILIFSGLYLTSLNSYILFHSLAEIFSIVIACGIFMIAWNSRRFLENNYLLFIGIAYLFVGGLDLIHTLAYKGMGVFQGYDTNLPTQLWIAARYLQGISLFLAPFFLRRKLKVNIVLLGYALITFFLLMSIFYWTVFPICFIEGLGLTPFKIISEYLISLIHLGSIVLLLRNRTEFDPSVLRWILGSIMTTIAAELAFTFYIHAYGFSNLIGHFFKILSFYFIYKAVIETGLSKPYNLLLRTLKENEVALREERDRAQRYLDIAGAILVMINRNQKVGLINKKGSDVLGYQEKDILGKNWFDMFIPERERAMVKETFIKLLSGQIELFEYFENSVLTRTGEERIIAWYNALLRDEKGNIVGTLSSGEDITERKRNEERLQKAHAELELRVKQRTAELTLVNEQLRKEMIERQRAEQALRESEMKYRIVAENTYNWEWWMGPGNKLIYTSPSCKRITGREPQEFMEDSDLLFKVIHPEDRPFFLEHKNEFEDKNRIGEIEFRIINSDGSCRWISHVCQPILDGERNLLGRRGSNLDITERKLAEEALRESEQRLRLLSSQLLTVQEAERKRIAREIHDGIGQTLAAIKFGLESKLSQMNRGNVPPGVTIENIISLAQNGIEEARRIQMDLRPSILDDLGITATIGWFIREFQKVYSHISVEKTVTIEENEIPGSLKTVLFRVMQEAMNNIAKHSQAKWIHLSLGKKADRIELSIQDNGLGFNPQSIKQGLGLTSMRERTELSGGTFEVRSTLGEGTTIKVRWPL